VFDDDNNDMNGDHNDDTDDESCNSVNFQVRTFIFCFEVHIGNTYDIMMMTTVA
jgi:hypothetical protein